MGGAFSKQYDCRCILDIQQNLFDMHYVRYGAVTMYMALALVRKIISSGSLGLT